MQMVLSIVSEPKKILKLLSRFIQEVTDKDNYAVQSGLADGSSILDADLGLRFFAIEFKDAATGLRHELKARFTTSHPGYLGIRLDRDLDQQRGDWVRLPAARLHVGTSGPLGTPAFHINLKFSDIPLAEGEAPREIVFDFFPDKK